MNIDELNLLDVHKSVEPCASAREQLQSAGGSRGFSLSRLSGQPGRCVWCEILLDGRRTRWCSERCLQSAMDYCYPQTPAAKMRRLIFDQACACKICGTSFESEIRGMIQDKFERDNRNYKTGDRPILVSLHHLGYNTGDIWQTDHIVPLFRGGAGIEPSNLQVVCTECHQDKTIKERK